MVIGISNAPLPCNQSGNRGGLERSSNTYIPRFPPWPPRLDRCACIGGQNENELKRNQLPLPGQFSLIPRSDDLGITTFSSLVI